jgi:predicted NBD/HSP70 family sugar kinase
VDLHRDDIGQRSETVRRANLSAIARELHASGPLSRSELVARTGLTRSAIRDLIAEFVAADLAEEVGSVPSGTPGRPSKVVQLDPYRADVLALEIAVDSLAAAVVGLGGHVLAAIRIDRPRGHSSVDDVIADVAELAAEVLEATSRRPRLIGVGVAVAGVVKRNDGFVSLAPNLGWVDVPFGQRLASVFGDGIAISIANDADLGALAEHRRGAAVGETDVLFVAGEVGVGGGIIVDGKPLTGSAGYAGEVGHLRVNPDGLPCHCGSTGCWETEIGERALLRRAGRAEDGGRVAVDEVLADAFSGRPKAVRAVRETGRWLGIGLGGLVNVFDPGLIVLGGFFGRIHPLIHDVIELELDRTALAAPRALVRVAPAALGVDAPILGAAELAFEPLLDDPAMWLSRRRSRTGPTTVGLGARTMVDELRRVIA